MDKKFFNKYQEIDVVLKFFKEDDVKVVLVVVGIDVSLDELKNIMFVEEYVVIVEKGIDFVKFVEKVMIKVIKGK